MGVARLLTPAVWTLGLCFVVFGVGCGRSSEPSQTAREQVAPVVESGLTSARPWIRAETVRLLGLIEAPAFLPELTRALRDESPLVQTAAIEAVLRLGDPTAEESALSRLISGNPEQRVQVMRLIVSSSAPAFQREVVRRSVRDVSSTVRLAALESARSVGLVLSVPELERLLEDEDPDLVDAAFRELVRADRQVALGFVLRSIRSSTPRERNLGMALARHLALPELWPMMRSYAASDEDTRAQELALVVLGHLADPMAEDALRTVVLAGDDDVAARALYAISFIPTQRAREQPLVHRRDSRQAVRAAAFDAMRRQGQPIAEFELFLEDSNHTLAERALAYMQETDPLFAAEAFARTLDESEDPTSAMWALYRTSLLHDIGGMLAAGSEEIEQLMLSNDPVIANLATRLMLTARPAESFVPDVISGGTSDALYAVIEATLTVDGNFSDLYVAALEHDLAAIRIAAAIGIWRLGNDFAPTVAEEAS